MLRNDLTPMQYRITFLDDGIRRTKYADDRRYYERLVAQHGHLGELRIEPLTLTAEQQQRLDEIQGAGLDPAEASLYVEWGTTEEEGAYHDPTALADYQRAQVAPAIEAQRKRAEAHGVIHNGIRYAGHPANRQALMECVQLAREAERTEFGTWKDSDGQYHADVAVSDIEGALMQIAARRDALIGLEGQYVAQVAAGELDLYELDWATPHD
ncbi:DUF4376 domain-containing protein [uncultured Halomonas sp.]|uniref:DUF4376 domain-containing protein n=1 Tax=uncultured Halomonas sp. TaxID=173971 RepID=UPI002623262E|nr:DUF4376 domain-containing protein [uncultured Halomonas sp.]